MITFHYFNSLIITKKCKLFQFPFSDYAQEGKIIETCSVLSDHNFHRGVVPDRALNLASVF